VNSVIQSREGAVEVGVVGAEAAGVEVIPKCRPSSSVA
jgi:hypothetical protein